MFPNNYLNLSLTFRLGFTAIWELFQKSMANFIIKSAIYLVQEKLFFLTFLLKLNSLKKIFGSDYHIFLI